MPMQDISIPSFCTIPSHHAAQLCYPLPASCCRGTPRLKHPTNIIIRRRRPKHTSNLLPRKPSNPPLLRPGNALNSPRLLHKRRIQPGRDPRHDGPVIPREFSRGDRHRRGPPQMVRRVAQIRRDLGRSRGRVVPDRGAVRGADGREAGEAHCKSRTSACFLGDDDFVEEADCGVGGGLPLALVDEFIEC